MAKTRKYQCVDVCSEITERPVWTLGEPGKLLKICTVNGRRVYDDEVGPEVISVFDDKSITLEFFADDEERLPIFLNIPLVVYGEENGECMKSLIAQDNGSLVITNYFFHHNSWKMQDMFVIN